MNEKPMEWCPMKVCRGWVVIPGNPVAIMDHSSRWNSSPFLYVGIGKLFCNCQSRKSLREPKWILDSAAFCFTSPTRKKMNPSSRLLQRHLPPSLVGFGITARSCAFCRYIWIIYSHPMSFLPHYWWRFLHGLVFGKLDGEMIWFAPTSMDSMLLFLLRGDTNKLLI